MPNNLYRFAFFFIILLSVWLRFWQLDRIPVGITPDEASMGYDAYALEKTGQDQYGHLWPMVFESFGDYKLPVPTYSMLPTVTYFGLNHLAVRLPGAIIGSLTVILVFLFAQQVFSNFLLSLLVMFLVAIAPWHVQLSRVSAPEVFSLFFFLAGTTVFLRREKNTAQFFVALLLLSVTFFCDTSMWIITPLWIMVLFWQERTTLRFSWQKIALVCMLIVVPLLILVASPRGKLFFEGSILHASASLIGQVHYARNIHAATAATKVSVAFANKYMQSFQNAAGDFFQLFDQNTYFFAGHPRERVGFEEMERLPFAQLPFTLLGLAALLFLKGRLPSSNISRGRLFAWWVILSLSAFTLTKTTTAAGTVLLLIPLEVVTVFGVIAALWYQQIVWRVIFVVITALFVANLSVFYSLYFSSNAHTSYSGREYGYQAMMQTIDRNSEPFERVKVSDSFHEPSIYFAFYKSVDPLLYQQQTPNAVFDRFSKKVIPQFGKYEFTSFLRKESEDGKTLYADIDKISERRPFAKKPAMVWRFPISHDEEGVVYHF